MVFMTFPEESTCLRICFPVLEWPPTQRLSDFIPVIWWINSISGTSMDDSKTGDFRYNGSLDNSPLDVFFLLGVEQSDVSSSFLTLSWSSLIDVKHFSIASRSTARR